MEAVVGEREEGEGEREGERKADGEVVCLLPGVGEWEREGEGVAAEARAGVKAVRGGTTRRAH